MLKKIKTILIFSTLGLLIVITMTNKLSFIPVISYAVLLIGILTLIDGIIDFKSDKNPSRYLVIIFSAIIFIASVILFIIS